MEREHATGTDYGSKQTRAAIEAEHQDPALLTFIASTISHLVILWRRLFLPFSLLFSHSSVLNVVTHTHTHKM